MVASPIAGKSDAFDELLRHAHIQPREFAAVGALKLNYLLFAHTASFAQFEAARFAKLFKAIAESDSAAADEVLRVWGIR